MRDTGRSTKRALTRLKLVTRSTLGTRRENFAMGHEVQSSGQCVDYLVAVACGMVALT